MSLIVYIFSVFFPCRRSSSALRVRSAGHALNLNKGCTKRQSLPNCQQNGRPGREYRGTTRQAAPADMQAGIPRIQKPWSGPNGSGKRSGATAGDKQPAARNRHWTTTNKRRAMNDGRRKGRCKGRCNEDRQDCGVRRQKNRPAQPQARRHGPKAGIQYLFLLA